MNRLDRHIAWRYLLNVVLLFVVFACFIVAIDVTLNLQRFVNAANRTREIDSRFELVLMTVVAVVDLWGPRLLQLSNYFIGLTLVAGMGFTAASFVRHREFIAMLASGRSLRRLAIPIFLIAALLTIGVALNQEFIIPRVAHLLPRGFRQIGQREFDTLQSVAVQDAAGRVFYMASYDDAAKQMTDAHIYFPADTDLRGARLWATTATWENDGWTLQNPRATGLPATAVVPTHITTDLTPQRILETQIEGYAQSMSWRQIDSIISNRAGQLNPSVRDRLNAIRYGRLAMALSNMLALMIALPFFLVREPRNMVTQSLKCAPLALIALIGASLGAAAPLPGLPIAVGVFAPAIVMIPIALWAIASIKT